MVKLVMNYYYTRTFTQNWFYTNCYSLFFEISVWKFPSHSAISFQFVKSHCATNETAKWY